MCTILMVEDNPDIRELIREVFARSLPICRLYEADTGRAFVAVLEHRMPSLVLLDVRLPDVSGIALYHHLRQRADGQEIPVLFVTAHHQLVREAGLTGRYTCLSKPFDVAALVAHVQTLLDLSGRV